MKIDDGIKLFDALDKLLSVTLWPGVVLFLLAQFGPPLKRFLNGLGEFSLKGGGFEASLKRQIDVAAELGAAEATRFSAQGKVEPEKSGDVNSSRAASETVKQAVTPRAMRLAQHARLLWVDDTPQNNVHAKRALEALGINVVISTSTEDALRKLSEEHFDVIISDMGRPPDPKAGYTLLDKLRTTKDETPFIIYSSSRAPEHQKEAKQRGASGSTNRPSELIQMVLAALDRS